MSLLKAIPRSRAELRRPETRHHRGRLLRALFLGILIAALGATALAALVRAETKDAADLPASARPEGLSLYIEATSRGTLTYVCGRTDAMAWAWILRASDATLRDAANRKIGTFTSRVAVIPPPSHPKSNWDGSDGASLVAALEMSAQFPGEDRFWERYEVRSRTGTGRFTAAKSIVRVSTAWKIRPETKCDASRAGTVTRLPYRATILFFK